MRTKEERRKVAYREYSKMEKLAWKEYQIKLKEIDELKDKCRCGNLKQIGSKQCNECFRSKRGKGPRWFK